MRVEAEASLSALIESTDDLIWSVDLDYRLIAFNRAFWEHFERNCSGPVVPGFGFEKLLSSADAEIWLPLYDMAFSGEKFCVDTILR